MGVSTLEEEEEEMLSLYVMVAPLGAAKILKRLLYFKSCKALQVRHHRQGMERAWGRKHEISQTPKNEKS